MNKIYESVLLKVLLAIFGLGTIIIGLFVFPGSVSSLREFYPAIGSFDKIIFIIGEVLLVELLIGIVIIINLLILFDNSNTFTFSFLRGLEILIILCILAFIGLLTLIGIFAFTISFNSILTLFLISVSLFILVLATVIKLIHSIVKTAIEYKTDYDLTV